MGISRFDTFSQWNFDRILKYHFPSNIGLTMHNTILVCPSSQGQGSRIFLASQGSNSSRKS